MLEFQYELIRRIFQVYFSVSSGDTLYYYVLPVGHLQRSYI